MKGQAIYRVITRSDNMLLKAIDLVSALATAAGTIAFLVTIKTEAGNTYFSDMFTISINWAYLLIFITVLLILARMLVRSILPLAKEKEGLVKNLDYMVSERYAPESPLSIEKMLTRAAKTAFITAQNWAGSFSYVKGVLHDFIAKKRSKRRLYVVLSDPEIMRLIFQSDRSGRKANDGYFHFVDPKSGTLSQIKTWLGSFTPEQRSRIEIYIHPGAAGLSSHLVEYRGGRRILVINPKFAGTSFPRLHIRIDSRSNKDAFQAILHNFNTMTHASNIKIEDMFSTYRI